MRAWWELYKKEILALSFFTVVIFLALFAWEIFLFYKADKWIIWLAFGLSFVPFALYPILILWLGYNSYRQEWKDDTHYFLLSLPRRGWEIGLAKLAASMSFYIGISLVTLLMIFVFHHGFIRGMVIDNIYKNALEPGMFIGLAIRLLLAYWIHGLTLYIAAQFSQLVSLFYDRFRGLITIIVFSLFPYVVYRGAILLAPLFRWLPELSLGNFVYFEFGIPRIISLSIGSGPFVAYVLMITAMFLLGSWLVEKHLEV